MVQITECHLPRESAVAQGEKTHRASRRGIMVNRHTRHLRRSELPRRDGTTALQRCSQCPPVRTGCVYRLPASCGPALFAERQHMEQSEMRFKGSPRRYWGAAPPLDLARPERPSALLIRFADLRPVTRAQAPTGMPRIPRQDAWEGDNGNRGYWDSGIGDKSRPDALPSISTTSAPLMCSTMPQ